ncbi:MAG: M14 family zinc carboxypeptidase [Verrucomicrobiia bacterium]
MKPIQTCGRMAAWLAWVITAVCVQAATAADAPWKPGGQRICIDGITFDSTIHCGNGHAFSKVGPDHYRFRARVGLEPYAWRFYFKMECPQAVGRTITLEVADFNHAGRTVFHESATVWSTDGRRWITMEPQQMEIVPFTPTGCAKLDAHYGDREHLPYGVRYRLRLTAPQMWFAVPTPYTLQRRDELLDRLAAAHPELVRSITVGQSRHSRSHGFPIRAARIAKPGDDPQRQNVVVIAGEHSAEVAGIYACEGWMQEVLAHGEWLDRYVFYFVPIMNVDGAYYGSTYYNLPRALTEGVGDNVSQGWHDRRLPEVKALWPLLAEWRAVFFASLHNGRHRTALEAFGPPGPGSEALLGTWRRELGLPFEQMRWKENPAAFNVLPRSGITPLAYTIETLLLVRQKGCGSFEESYLQTGRQLARGTVAALDAMPPDAKRPEASVAHFPQNQPSQKRLLPGPPSERVRLAGADFTAQLPWFYHNLPFERWQRHDVYSFEVNGWDLPPGQYAVALLPRGNPTSLAVGFDGSRFQQVPVRDGRAELPSVRIDNRMLSLYLKTPGAPEGGPLESVLVYPAGEDAASAGNRAVPFAGYRRDTRAQEREILNRDAWGEFYSLLRRDSFGKKELRAMFNDLLEWCRRRQVMEPGDRHYGAIYSEEDKYDFRDAAAAAVCFTHAWRDTGDEQWRRRALAARAYAFKGQHVEDPANRNQYGGLCQMVPSFRRLGDKLPDVNGVETCIAINHLVKTFELGLEPSEQDLRRLELAARWVAASEFQPGKFQHHEGTTWDCQNSNALGAMALARAHHALDKRGRHPPESWLEAARRGMRHWMEGQEAIGCWPYRFAMIGRGQAFHERNLPDQGMGTYHFLVACGTPVFRSEPNVQDRMRRVARWWLCTSRIDRQPPLATIDLDDRQTSGALKFSAFTWCRFMAAASLMRIAEPSGEGDFWRQLALRYMEHVYTKLWNRTDPNTAPVMRATRDDMKVRTWIQAAEWDAALLRDMEERLP